MLCRPIPHPRVVAFLCFFFLMYNGFVIFLQCSSFSFPAASYVVYVYLPVGAESSSKVSAEAVADGNSSSDGYRACDASMYY